VGVATHRAASSSEPYFDTASRRSCSWYAGERQPLSTTNSTPSSAASVAARRRAPSRPGSSLATPGTSPSKTVVPSGTAPPASPSASRCSLRERSTGVAADEGEGTVECDGTVEGEGAVKDDDTSDLEPRAAAIATMATSKPAARRLRIRIRQVVARAGLLRVTPPLKAAWCCQHVCDFRYADDMCLRLTCPSHAALGLRLRTSLRPPRSWPLRGRGLCRLAVGHAASQVEVLLPARVWFSICRRYAFAGSTAPCRRRRSRSPSRRRRGRGCRR
jgi:hypothetical protein